MDGAQPGELALDLGERVITGAVDAEDSAVTRRRIVEPVGRVLRDVKKGEDRVAAQAVAGEGLAGDDLVRGNGRQIFDRARVLRANRIISEPKSTVT